MATHNLQQEVHDVVTTPRSRRDVLKKFGLDFAIPAAASVLAACGVSSPTAPTAAKADTGNTSNTHKTSHDTAKASDSGKPSWEDMDRMYEAGIKAFPAQKPWVWGTSRCNHAWTAT